ncbi:uncharacterized protein PgNI_02474, partial [Pyricularia grisea]|uniref:Uncharacterized protein n=1 Tax=Pyricularia grisea TaxID=148305 RepID=A0A6P8BI61_PYRGI
TVVHFNHLKAGYTGQRLLHPRAETRSLSRQSKISPSLQPQPVFFSSFVDQGSPACHVYSDSLNPHVIHI